MLTISLTTTNSAFDDDALCDEVADILSTLANNIRDGGAMLHALFENTDAAKLAGTLRDANGNTCGTWAWEEKHR